MKIGVLKEHIGSECRVSLSPGSVVKIIKMGFEVIIEQGAGTKAHFFDNAYEDAGAKIVSKDDIFNDSDILVKIHAPDDDEMARIKEGTTLISMIWPAQNEAFLQRLSDKKMSAIAMDSIPRISRAQKMDVLSSMSNIAGYRAIIEASSHFGRFLGGQITAAGKIAPAKVLIIGAGVAGLSAIGTASALGAIVRAFDTRPEVKEQVESMSAEFLEVHIDEDGSSDSGYAKTMSKEFIEAEMKLFLDQAKEVDIIVTTALIPGKPAPKLITQEMVEAMKKGSVIVDLAAAQGGNCAVTKEGEVVEHNGVKVLGYSDLPSRLPGQASELYGANITHLLTDLTPAKNGQIDMNFDDEVIRGASVVKAGEITFPPPPIKVSKASSQPAQQAPKVAQKPAKDGGKSSSLFGSLAMVIGALLTLYIGNVAPSSFLAHFVVFVLSCFIGYQVIWSVTPALHTPLMSVTNAISGIIIIGGLVQINAPDNLSVWIATVAILIATINIVGGFSVTQKTLRLFTK